MRTTQDVRMLVIVTAAMYTCAGEQVGTEILPIPLAKLYALTLACRTKGGAYLIFSKLLSSCQAISQQGRVHQSQSLFQITQRHHQG